MPELTPNLNIPKPLGTENVNRASFNSIYDAIDENASQAANIRIADTANQFSSENVEGALGELFTFAGNGKADMAAVIGSPAASTDTFAQLKTKAQDAKNTLATNLTAKGTTAVGTETMAALAAKVANVQTGKKFASGVVISGGPLLFYKPEGGSLSTQHVQVSGIDFEPSYIIVESMGSVEDLTMSVYSTSSSVNPIPKIVKLSRHSGGSRGTTTYTTKVGEGAAYVNSSGFLLPFLGLNNSCRWVAYE